MTFGTIKADLMENSNGLTGKGFGPGFVNRIINGDMRIDQRNAGAAVTVNTSATTVYPVDRFGGVGVLSAGVFTLQQDASAPVGFINSIKAVVTTADTSLATTSTYRIVQKIEGTNIADLAWGSASAKTITLSFWVQSSLTGTFGGALRNSGNTRSYPFTYTISSANTWEQKTITIAGDTTGTWLTTTGLGVEIAWALGAGTDRSGTAGAWAGANCVSATGATSVIGTLNAAWYITGVQLEVGSVATPFERRPYGTELALCQRYYYLGGAGASGQVDSTNTTRVVGLTFPVSMRATPSGAMATSSITTLDFGQGEVTNSSPTFSEFRGTNMGGFVKITGWSAGTSYRGTVFTTNSIAMSVEL